LHRVACLSLHALRVEIAVWRGILWQFLWAKHIIHSDFCQKVRPTEVLPLKQIFTSETHDDIHIANLP
jgi:hypothetical protein